MMVLQLLPASAKAFAVRTKPNVVLNSRAETWLTQTLKRTNRQKKPLNNVSQHRAVLEDILSGHNAIWSLASIMLARAPEPELVQDDDPLVEALSNYQLLHIDGYVVHVDMVSQHEVAFKLTQETIDSLIAHHNDVYCVDAAASYTYDWPEKDKQVKKMQADFVQAVNSYVFRAHVRALEGLENDGSGELLEGRSQDVKVGIEHLFRPLLPPPPKIVDVMGPPYLMSSTLWSQHYAEPWRHAQFPHNYHYLPTPIESWRALESLPSPISSHGEQSAVAPWSHAASFIASPSPPYSEPYSCSPQHVQMPTVTPVPASLPLPSELISQQCANAAATAYGDYWGVNDAMQHYPISI